MEDFLMVKKNKKETMEVTGVDIEELTELQEGTDAFQSYGYSYVKITRNGEIKALKIPIRSSGVTELIEEWKKNEPKPPITDQLVTPDSEIGKQMKLAQKRWIKMPNLADEKYVEELDAYQSNLGMAIVQKGLALKMKDKEGNEITDGNKKTEVLKRMGLSGSQFSQMVNDIRTMTEWSEEELVNFFGMSLEGQTMEQ
jgi:hypothetical protein